MIPRSTCIPFEIRGDVGVLCGLAYVWSSRRDPKIAGIKLHSPTPGGSDRTVDRVRDKDEFAQIEAAIIRQDGERIGAAVAAIFERAFAA